MAEETKIPSKKLDCMVQSRDEKGEVTDRKVPHYFQWYWRGQGEGKAGTMTDLRRCTTCLRFFNLSGLETNEEGTLLNPQT